MCNGICFWNQSLRNADSFGPVCWYGSRREQVDYFEAMNFTFSDPPVITVDYGKKYAKIVKTWPAWMEARSVHSFIDMSNGDIIKGNWKAPVRTKAKGLAIRGNIFADDLGSDRVNEHGPYYLRR